MWAEYLAAEKAVRLVDDSVDLWVYLMVASKVSNLAVTRAFQRVCD